MKVLRKPRSVPQLPQSELQRALREYVAKLKSGKITPRPLPKRNPKVEAKKLNEFVRALTTAGLSAEQCRKITGKRALSNEEIHEIAKSFNPAKIVAFKKRFHPALHHNPNIENFFQSLASRKFLEELKKIQPK